MLPVVQRGIPNPLDDPASAPFVSLDYHESNGNSTTLTFDISRGNRKVLERQLIAEAVGYPYSAWLAYLPYPFLLAAALFSWIAALAWRARLRKKEITPDC